LTTSTVAGGAGATNTSTGGPTQFTGAANSEKGSGSFGGLCWIFGFGSCGALSGLVGV